MSPSPRVLVVLAASLLAAVASPPAAPAAAEEASAPPPLAALRRAAGLVHRPADHGLSSLRARFTFTTTGFGAGGRRTAGDLLWRAGDGLWVRFGEEAPDASLAGGLLESLQKQLAGAPDFLAVSEGDAVTRLADGVFEVVPHATESLRGMGEPLGWEGVPRLRYRLSEEGWIEGITATGTPCEEAAAAGMPDGVAMTCAWTPLGKEALLRGITMRLTAGGPESPREVGFPFSRMGTAIVHAPLGGARVPTGITLEITANLGGRTAVRKDVLELTDLAANPGIGEQDLAGFSRVGAAPEEPAPLAVGDPAPPWEGVLAAGGTVGRAGGPGRVRLLLFWATWCGPCKRSIPVVQDLLRLHGEKGFEVFAITCAETDRAGRSTGDDPFAVLDAHGGRFPVVVAGDGVAAAYRVAAYPTLVLVGADGTIAYQRVGFGPGAEEELRAAVASAVAAAGAGGSSRR